MDQSDQLDINLDPDNDLQAPDSLDSLRERLKNDSTGSRLIHCPLEHSEVVRLVDELPDQVYDMLCDGKEFEMAAVPEPSRQELLDEGYLVFQSRTGEFTSNGYPEPEAWARRHRINPDFELSGGKSGVIDLGHADDRLQSLLFPAELESRLFRMRQLAQSALDETGGNELYLSLGFLEWYESASSRTPHLSPVFNVPVELRRDIISPTKLDSSEYLISLREEGLYDNTCLSSRLLQDFGVALPTLEDDSLPEFYFAALRQVIDGVDSRWRVRRFAALCRLDFSRQLMYEDLAPFRWPDKSDLTENSLLQQCLSSESDALTGHALTPLTDHPIDKLPNIHRDYPLIHDADSSQHSALIDVVNGHNLVISGSPGSGKSQTIANVVAACLNKGLNVLFMSNKRSALEVVRRRLDEAQLGDFCLELHTLATNRSAFLDSLNSSYKRREAQEPPAGLQEQINRYEEHRKILHEYTRKLNEPWRTTELTPHQILQRATDFTDCAPSLNEENLVQLDDPAILNATFIRQTLESAERLQVVFSSVADQTPESTITAHPWFGLTNAAISPSQRSALMEALERWTEKQECIMTLWDELQDKLQVEPCEAPAQATLSAQLQSLDQLPQDIPETLLQRLDELRTHAGALEALRNDRERLRLQFSQLSASFKPTDLLSLEQADAVTHVLLSVRDELGSSDTVTLDTIARHVELLAQLRQRIAAFFDDARKLQNSLHINLDNTFAPTLDALQALGALSEVCAQLPPRLWRYRNDRYRDPGFLAALDDIEPRVLSLRERYAQLHPSFDLEQLPDSQRLQAMSDILGSAGFFAFFRSEFRQARKQLNELSRSDTKASEAVSLLPQLVNYQQNMEELHATQQRHPALGNAYRSLDTNLTLHRTLLQWYQSVEVRLGESGQKDFSLADALFTLDINAASQLRETAVSGLRENALHLRENVEKVQSIYPHYFSAFSSQSNLLDSGLGLTGLHYRLEAHLAKLRQCIVDPSLSLSNMIEQAELWSSTTREHHEWLESESCKRFVPSLCVISANPQVDDSLACSILELATSLVRLAPSGSLLCRAMQCDPTLTQLDVLRTAGPALLKTLDEASSEQTVFETLGQVNRTQWQSDEAPLSQCHRHNTRALQQAHWLDTWLSYQRARQRASSNALGSLMDRLENGSIRPDQTLPAIEADLYRQLALYMLQQDDELASLDSNEMQAIRQQFKRYDKELQLLQRLQIAANCARRDVPLGNSRGTADSLSELLLIQQESMRHKPELPLRSLFKRAPGAIQALKPCFMMSPASVARYLEPGQYAFDVIIIDESSQMHLEEALGGIARARQLLLVGDRGQLPPRSLCKHSAYDERAGESEASEERQGRSILDAVTLVLPRRRLRWHYRSQHESLFSFAAREFNDAETALYPSPLSQTEQYGINFTRLGDGSCNHNVNHAEADHIVTLLARQIQQRPHESVGIIAMSGQQRDQIEACWEKRLLADSFLRRTCEKKQTSDEPLFFKALTNIQGDERDVIMISLTFGPRMNGSDVLQKFGSIDSHDGWRHLNVLLTRSRKRMEIIASMGSSDIRTDESSPRGVHSLRAFLAHCENTCLERARLAQDAPDNAFESALIRRLADAGFPAEPRLGMAGTFIDVAVRNPDRPDDFLLGIDGDGTDHRSAESIRDREHLRDKILGRLGWNLRRICSTDWFRNADAQTGLIVAELEQLRIAANHTSHASRGNQKNGPGTSISAHAVRNSRFIDV